MASVSPKAGARWSPSLPSVQSDRSHGVRQYGEQSVLWERFELRAGDCGHVSRGRQTRVRRVLDFAGRFLGVFRHIAPVVLVSDQDAG